MNADVPALAAAARQGQMSAFEQLVKLFMRRAYFFCLGICGNRDDALDISQNAFVRAWRGIGRLSDPASFPSWLFSILRHEAANFLKKRGRTERRELTGNTILSSPEALIKYGILGGLGYSLMGAFAFILFALNDNIANYICPRQLSSFVLV